MLKLSFSRLDSPSTRSNQSWAQRSSQFQRSSSPTCTLPSTSQRTLSISSRSGKRSRRPRSRESESFSSSSSNIKANSNNRSSNNSFSSSSRNSWSKLSSKLGAEPSTAKNLSICFFLTFNFQFLLHVIT